MRRDRHLLRIALSGAFLSLLVAAGLPAAASPIGPEGGTAIEGPPRLQAQAERARKALVPLKKRLMQALKGALQQGPEAAIDACRIEAPAIATSLSSREISVGRTSHALRNPDNAPQGWLKPLLDEFLARPPRPGAGKAVELADGGVGYVEPIYVKPLCTTCHGKAVAPALLAHIRKLYPQDRALGFEPGDFRGLFWAKIEPKAKATSTEPR